MDRDDGEGKPVLEDGHLLYWRTVLAARNHRLRDPEKLRHEKNRTGFLEDYRTVRRKRMSKEPAFAVNHFYLRYPHHLLHLQDARTQCQVFILPVS